MLNGLKDICRAVLEPLLWFLSMLLGLLSCWKMNCHPSLGSRALWSRCSSRMPRHHNAAFIFSSVLTILPVPAAEKHPNSMLLMPPPYFSAGLMSTCFLQTWNLTFTRKCLICTSEKFIPRGLGIRCLLDKFRHASVWRCRDSCPSRRFSSRNRGEVLY